MNANTVGAEEPESRIASGHNLLSEADGNHGLAPGDAVGRLSFRDTGGDDHHLGEMTKSGPVVFLFLSTKCPLAKRYTARLNRLHDQYDSQGVQLIGLFPNSDETDQSIAEYLQSVQYPFPVVRDISGYVASRLGASMTPQAVVIDQQQRLRFRGPIDDNRYANRVKHHYLSAALTALLADQPIEQPVVKSVGCSIHRSQANTLEVTYSSHIARILQDNCQSCHRAGQVAPFAITNYEEAAQWKTEIKEYTAARLMPPWKASPGFGHFKNDSSLDEQEIRMLAGWVDAGAPLGVASDVPPAPSFNDDWAYGQPDLVVEMPEEYEVGPEGEDDYRHFVIPHRDDQDRFVEAIDVRPGNRSVVHHVIAYIDTSGVARQLDAADPGPGYTKFGGTGFEPVSVIGGWAPGNDPVKAPIGSGQWLPANCDIVLQVHYYRTGVPERDQTSIGVYYSKAPRPVPVRRSLAINNRFEIPAGKAHHVVRASREIKEDSYLFSVTPHMHLIGRTMEVTAQLPDGSTLPIVRIDDWDFNWQATYHLNEMQLLPAGTRIKMVATFDNSADNPNNPNDPPISVRWGEKTTDEMCIAFVNLLRKSEYDPRLPGRRIQGLTRAAAR